MTNIKTYSKNGLQGKTDLQAVLSTTVLPLDGNYKVATIDSIDISGVPHFIGHPDTKDIVQSLGAIKADSNLFSGLQVGQSAVCFSIKQGMSTRKDDGFTIPHQNVDMSMLSIRLITRLDD